MRLSLMGVLAALLLACGIPQQANTATTAQDPVEFCAESYFSTNGPDGGPIVLDGRPLTFAGYRELTDGAQRAVNREFRAGESYVFLLRVDNGDGTWGVEKGAVKASPGSSVLRICNALKRQGQLPTAEDLEGFNWKAYADGVDAFPIGGLAGENARLKAELDELRHKNVALTEQSEDLRAERDALGAQAKNLAAALAAKSKELADAVGAVNNLAKRVDDLTVQVTALTKAVQDLVAAKAPATSSTPTTTPPTTPSAPAKKSDVSRPSMENSISMSDNDHNEGKTRTPSSSAAGVQSDTATQAKCPNSTAACYGSTPMLNVTDWFALA